MALREVSRVEIMELLRRWQSESGQRKLFRATRLAQATARGGCNRRAGSRLGRFLGILQYMVRDNFPAAVAGMGDSMSMPPGWVIPKTSSTYKKKCAT